MRRARLSHQWLRPSRRWTRARSQRLNRHRHRHRVFPVMMIRLVSPIRDGVFPDRIRETTAVRAMALVTVTRSLRKGPVVE